MTREESATRVFIEDLKLAASAWAKAPGLPLMTLALSAVFAVEMLTDQVGTLLVALPLLLIALFNIGFCGTQRIWYLRVWRHEPMTASEVWNYSLWFFGRYFALGVLSSLPFIPFYILMQVAETGWIVAVIATISALLYDFILTFATPALAYTTPNATAAMKTNFEMIREFWPTTALYVFIPPLAALILLQRFPENTLDPWIDAGLSLMLAMIVLLMKGATAAFFLRHHPEVPSSGAIHLRSSRETVL